MRLVAYRRLSPDGSVTTDERRQKLENQLDHIREFCDREEHEIVEIFTDEQESGRKSYPHERDGWSEMIHWLISSQEGRETDGIIFKDLSRWSRRVSVTFGAVSYTRAILWSYGTSQRDITLISALDEETPEGHLLEFDNMQDIPMDVFFNRFLTGYQDQQEASRTAEKVQRELDKKVVKGKPPRGLTTDKQLNEEITQATRWLPDEPKFSRCLEVCLRLSDPTDQESKTGIGREMGFPEGSEWDTVDRIWKNRHKYLMTVLWHEEAQALPWYDNTRDYDIDWDWIEEDLVTEDQMEIISDLGER